MLPSKGYLRVENEVTFLKVATTEKPLLIQGERLCVWAETYYSARDYPFEHVVAPADALRKVFPRLSRAQAQKLSEKMGVLQLDQSRVSTNFILERLYSSDINLWQQGPSPNHAARWLLWLYENEPDETVQAILQYHVEFTWKNKVTDIENKAYQATNRDEARQIMFSWFGLTHDMEWKTLGEFPVPIPNEFQVELHRAWRLKIIKSQGLYFGEMLEWPLSPASRQLLAQESLVFFQKNPDNLITSRLKQLRSYLSVDNIASLEQIVPPPSPPEIPDEVEAMIRWFKDQYLPYRCWQANSENNEARQRIRHLAADFAVWYLRNYPKWILEHRALTFYATADLVSPATDSVTLVVVLDGFPAWDVPSFILEVSAKTRRLILSQTKHVLAPLPTVTKFAKDALLKGVPPCLAQQHSALGEIVPDNALLQDIIQQVQPGEVLFWILREPDHTYHYAHQARLAYKVNAQLSAIVDQLVDVIESIPEHYHLCVIVTTDHGRLLNKHSPRSISVPQGMQSHGRVAWGENLSNKFDETGFSINDNDGVILVYGERFDVGHDLVISLYEDTFKTNDGKRGSESYPHGGLFPEEVIVPWLIFERDVSAEIEVSINGEGNAGKEGILQVHITNLNDIHLTLFSVRMSTGAQQDGEWEISPRASVTEKIHIHPWPTKSEANTANIDILLRMPDGRTFEKIIQPQLEVTEMYSRDDSLLKDLGL